MSVPPPPPAAPAAPPQPVQRGRLSPAKVVLFVGAGLSVVLIVAYLAVLSNAPAADQPDCQDQQCDPVTAPALVNGTLFQGDLGWQVQYSPEYWKAVDEGADSLQLQDVGGHPVWVTIEATSGDTDPQALFDDKVKTLSEQILGMKETNVPEFAITNPGVGDRHGPGALYTGTVDSPQGPSTPVGVAVMSATDGDVTVVVSVVADQKNYGYAAQQGDSILNTFLYPSETDV
ncbi:MAG TPA: hypothetical protein VFK89_08360 [Actinomycetota bacterium]|nr:hypothetical protein [Actinomycetota bacterium]